jgi:predicted transcriptional regulator
VRKRRPNDTGAAVFHARKVASQSECTRVLAVIDGSPGTGCTIKEIAVATGIPDHIVSARIGDLRDAGVIEEAPLRRKCRVNGIRKKVFARAPQSGQMSLKLGRTA